MVNVVPHLITEEYIGQLMLSEARAISFNNGDYWWELKTPAISHAYTTLHCDAQDFFDQLIDEREFVVRLHQYFQVVYDESFKEWQKQYGYKPPYFGPIPDVKLGLRELRFLNDRWATWQSRDNELVWAQYDYQWDNYRAEIFAASPIHNDVLDSDYEDIKPSGIIGSLDWEIPFGKYKGKSIRYVLTNRPDYLDWMMRKTDKFKFSDELKKLINAECEQDAFETR